MLQDVVNEVAAAKELFQQASDILGYDLLKICTEGKDVGNVLKQLCLLPAASPASLLQAGPNDKLDSTAVSQPAIYVASLAALEKLKQDEGQVRTHACMLLGNNFRHAPSWPQEQHTKRACV